MKVFPLQSTVDLEMQSMKWYTNILMPIGPIEEKNLQVLPSRFSHLEKKT